MAFSKAYKYELSAQMVNNIMRAVCHPARQKILKTLKIKGPCTVKTLLIDHPICETTFSDHLKILRSGGLIVAKEEYPFTYYSIDKKGLLLAIEVLIDFIKFFYDDEAST